MALYTRTYAVCVCMASSIGKMALIPLVAKTQAPGRVWMNLIYFPNINPVLTDINKPKEKEREYESVTKCKVFIYENACQLMV